VFPYVASEATNSATSLAVAFDDSSDGAKVTGDVSNWNSSVHIPVVNTGPDKQEKIPLSDEMKRASRT
jgi:hypothetical protein